MNRRILMTCLILGLGCAALAPSPALAQRHDWSDAEHWAKVFDDPERDKWQRPLTLSLWLGISRGETVADIGAGTGYFTRHLVAAISPSGLVYAVDVEEEMLDHLMSREDILTKLVEPVVAAKDDPGLPDGKIDLVVSMNTWHHIKKRTKYIKKLEQALSPEGRVAVIDWRLGDFPVGPTDSKKLSRDDVVKEFEKVGFRLVSETMSMPYHYGLIFLPPETPDKRRFVNR